MNQKILLIYSLLLFSLFATSLPFNADAQSSSHSIEVKGTVIDENNLPLPGVSVHEVGTPRGTQTDLHGEFKLTTNSNATLSFSMIGYSNKEIAAGSKQPVQIIMNSTAQNLKDVVVIGYGTQKRADVTGSISSIKGADIANTPVINVLDAMASKVPGLDITDNSGRPGGDLHVSIRGINSINASNDPLYVIDGLVGGDLQMLNPSDVESVDVLKDASATAIYGSRASNGVIIVTTKHPKKGESVLTYDVNLSAGKIARETDMLDANGYMEYEKRAWEYDPARGPFPTDQLYSYYPNLFNPDGTPKYNTDWQKAATRTAFSDRHALSLTSATDKSKQGLYLGYQNEQGILLDTYDKKYSVRYTSEVSIKPWLTLGGSLTYNSTKKNQPDLYGIGSMNATRTLAGMIPILPVTYPNGTASTMEDFGFGFNADGSAYKSGIYTADNPVTLLNDVVYIQNASQVLSNLYATVKITKDLEFRTTFDSWINDTKDDIYIGKDILDIGTPTAGVASSDYNKNVYWQTESFLSYKKMIGEKHRINLVAGASWSDSETEGFSAGSTGFSTDYYQYNNLGAGAVKGTPGSYYLDERLNSYYARANYAYDDKYLLTFTGRTDGSSKFGDANKYALFPSGAIGWIVSRESFLKNSTVISNLKLRASYGITGNSGISPYSSLSTINNYAVYLNDNRYVGTAQGRVPNPDLKWEQTAQTDIGFDLGLFGNRLNLVADYYDKKTTNLLLDNPLSIVSGYSSVSDNIGSVRNRGYEFALNGTVINGKDFSWMLGVNLSTNKNTILALGTNNADIFPGYQLPGGINYTILRKGGSVGDFFGYTRLGTWGTAEAAEAAKYGDKPGDIKRKDVNGDGQYTIADAGVLGNMFPKYTMGINTTVHYRNWDLSADIQIVHGNDVINASAFELEDRQYYLNSYASLLKDAWTPQHQNTMVPAIRYITDNNASDYPSGYMDSHWLEDGSYIRGKNITLGYTMPGSILSALSVSKIRIYANAQNFFLITKYRGYDPESSSVSGAFTQGTDYFGYPKARTYSIGLNVIF